MATPQQLKKHHKAYLQENHNILPLTRLREGLENLRLFWSKHRIRKWLKENKMSWIEDEKKPQSIFRPQQNRAYQQKKKKEEDGVMEMVLKKHYPEGGAKEVKEILNRHNIYRTTPQINYQARRFNVRRNRDKKPMQKHKTIPISQTLQKAFYLIEDFNERYSTSFTIFANDDSGGEVVDKYISVDRGEGMVLSLVGVLFKEGYKIQKGKEINFYIWGGE